MVHVFGWFGLPHMKGREVYAKRKNIIVKHVVSNILVTRNDLTSVRPSMLHVGESDRVRLTSSVKFTGAILLKKGDAATSFLLQLRV
jgi:hypothetical protein